jgi:hypothetical protein
MRQFWSIDPANEQRLCWNLNALLQKIGDGNRGEITISWMVNPVTAIAIRPPRIAAGCCSFVSKGDPARCPRSLPITRSRRRHRRIDERLRDQAAGRKIAALHKNQSGR